MRGALGLFGLALVLFSILIVGPYVKSFTEGFSDAAAPSQNVVEKVSQTQDLKEKVIELQQDITSIEKMLEAPDLEKTTRDKLLAEIEDRRTQIAKLTGQPVPTATPAPTKEGFEAILSSDLERNSRNAAAMQMALQSPF